jgi:GNAT superfamily N-acetyltransferase
LLARAGVRRAVLYDRQLDEPVVPRSASKLEHGWLDRSGVVRLAGATRQQPAELLGRLDRGERCFGSQRDGRVVAARWASQGAVHADYLRVGLRLPAGHAWIFDSWTDPAERGRGIAGEASAALGAALATEGTTRFVAIVMTGNRAGHTAVLRSGYTRLGTITTIRTSPRRRAVRFRAG